MGCWIYTHAFYQISTSLTDKLVRVPVAMVVVAKDGISHSRLSRGGVCWRLRLGIGAAGELAVLPSAVLVWRRLIVV